MNLIHLEHAMPPLAELGLEHLVPVFLGGGRVQLDSESIASLLRGLAIGAEKRSVRRLVAISMATGEDLLEWEVDGTKEKNALKAAALLGFDEAKEAVVDFFASLGLSPNSIQVSSGPVGEESPREMKDAPEDPVES